MGDTKERILDRARDLFLEQGLAHVSMRKVAASVGLSATALYRHYANKEDLLCHVLLRGFEVFADYLGRVDEEQDPLACLDATAEAYLTFALDEHAYYEMMFMTSEQMTGLAQLNEDGAIETRQTFEILQRRVKRAIASGAIEGEDAYVAAFSIWAYAHGQVALHLCGKTGLGRREFTARYRSLMRAHIRSL